MAQATRWSVITHWHCSTIPCFHCSRGWRLRQMNNTHPFVSQDPKNHVISWSDNTVCSNYPLVSKGLKFGSRGSCSGNKVRSDIVTLTSCLKYGSLWKVSSPWRCANPQPQSAVPAPAVTCFVPRHLGPPRSRCAPPAARLPQEVWRALCAAAPAPCAGEGAKGGY